MDQKVGKWGSTRFLDKREAWPQNSFFFFLPYVRVSVWPKIKVEPRPLVAPDPPLLIQANEIVTELVDGKVTSAAKTNPN